jgi:hypothetical protein
LPQAAARITSSGNIRCDILPKNVASGSHGGQSAIEASGRQRAMELPLIDLAMAFGGRDAEAGRTEETEMQEL